MNFHTHKDSHYPLTYPCSTFTNNHDNNMIYQPISNRFSRVPTCYRATQQPLEAPVQQVRSSPAARAALMNSVRQGDLISALEEEDRWRTARDDTDGGVWGFTICWTHLPVNRCVLFFGGKPYCLEGKAYVPDFFWGKPYFWKTTCFLVVGLGF